MFMPSDSARYAAVLLLTVIINIMIGRCSDCIVNPGNPGFIYTMEVDGKFEVITEEIIVPVNKDIVLRCTEDLIPTLRKQDCHVWHCYLYRHRMDKRRRMHTNEIFNVVQHGQVVVDGKLVESEQHLLNGEKATVYCNEGHSLFYEGKRTTNYTITCRRPGLEPTPKCEFGMFAADEAAPAAAPAAAAAQSGGDSDGDGAGGIVGGVIAGLAVAAMAGIGIWYFVIRKKNKKKSEEAVPE